jgi:hypothetical protein
MAARNPIEARITGTERRLARRTSFDALRARSGTATASATPGPI